MDEWEWGVVIYHCLEEEGTNKIEQFIKKSKDVREPWINKSDFKRLSDVFIEDGGVISIERVYFEPHNDYSGFGMSLQVRGKKTKNIIDKIESEYAVLPRKIGLDMEDGLNGQLKFEMTNRGRISFSSGSIASQILIISKFVDFVKENDKRFDLKQSKKINLTPEISVRKINDVFKINMPSSLKIGVSNETRNAAIIEMLTTGGGIDGYIGIPIGPNRVSVLDLKEKRCFRLR